MNITALPVPITPATRLLADDAGALFRPAPEQGLVGAKLQFEAI